jgi:hypothetical protein
MEAESLSLDTWALYPLCAAGTDPRRVAKTTIAGHSSKKQAGMEDHPSMCPICTKPYTLDHSGASAVPKVRAERICPNRSTFLERPNPFVGENRLPPALRTLPAAEGRRRAGSPLHQISVRVQFSMDRHFSRPGGNKWLISACVLLCV